MLRAALCLFNVKMPSLYTNIPSIVMMIRKLVLAEPVSREDKV